MSASGPIKTLIVDDDADVRRLHAGYIADIDGFHLVGAVGHGEAAAEFAARGDVDLVLLDMNLPDFSGIEVLHRLRSGAGAEVDVLVISSARDRLTVRQALSASVIGYLAKPFTAEALAQRLVAYRDGRAAEASEERQIPLGQGEIDRMLRLGGTSTVGVATQPAPRSSPAGATTPDLPKGISRTTLEAVQTALHPVHPHTAVEIAQACGMSRATARRYLDLLISTAQVDVSHRYGRRGRPEVLYRLAPTSPG